MSKSYTFPTVNPSFCGGEFVVIAGTILDSQRGRVLTRRELEEAVQSLDVEFRQQTLQTAERKVPVHIPETMKAGEFSWFPVGNLRRSKHAPSEILDILVKLGATECDDGRLSLGRTSNMLCIVMKNGRDARIYLDHINDGTEITEDTDKFPYREAIMPGDLYRIFAEVARRRAFATVRAAMERMS